MALADWNAQVVSVPHGGPTSACCAWCDPALRSGPRGAAWRKLQGATKSERRNAARYLGRDREN